MFKYTTFEYNLPLMIPFIFEYELVVAQFILFRKEAMNKQKRIIITKDLHTINTFLVRGCKRP